MRKSAPRSAAQRPRVVLAARTWRARVAVLFGGAAVLFATSSCVWDGLDEYSSKYGQTTTSDGGGQSTTTTTTNTGTPCPCGVGQECVAGSCEPCTPLWGHTFKGLVFNNPFSVSHVFDPGRDQIHVSAIRSDGQQHGYLASLSHCRGTLLHVHDGDLVGSTPLPPLSFMALSSPAAVPQVAAQVFAGLHVSGDAVNPPQSLGGFVRYDPGTGELLSIVENTDSDPAMTSQAPWALATTSKAVWTSGIRAKADGAHALAIRWNGVKFCSDEIPDSLGYTGRAITSRGDQVAIAADGPDVRVWLFDDAVCDPTACGCAPDASIPSLAMNAPLVMGAKLVSNSILVSGISGFSGGNPNWSGFLAQYVFGEDTWRPPIVYDMGPNAEGLIGLDSDGSSVFVGAFRDYVPGDASSPTAEVQIYGLPFTAGALMQQRIDAPSLGSIFNLSLDSDGMILSGYLRGSGADGRTVRCTMKACP